MSVEEAVPEEFAGNVTADPVYFRIFFAAVTPDGALEYKDQTSENGAFSASFTQLTNASFATERLNASVTQEGYVALLAQDSGSGNLAYIRENRDENAPQRFADPLDLGKPAGVPSFNDTLLINGVTGRQNIFVTSSAPDNAIWWRFQNNNTVQMETIKVVPPGTTTPIEVTVPVEIPPGQPWADWQQMAGALRSLAATQNADGRIILTGINSDGVPYLNFQSTDRPLLPEGWEGWKDISGGLTGFEQLVLCIDGNALVHIFARIGNKIYMKAQDEVSSLDFSDWALFATFDAPVGSMAASNSSNGGIYLVALTLSGSDSPVFASYQTSSVETSWTAPRVIAHADGGSTLKLQPNANTLLSLFALDPVSNTASYLPQISLDHWSATWTSLGGPLSVSALTRDVTPNTQ